MIGRLFKTLKDLYLLININILCNLPFSIKDRIFSKYKFQKAYLLVILLGGEGDFGVNIMSLPDTQPGDATFLDVTEDLKKKKKKKKSSVFN